MDLILWRHAEAEPGKDDLARALTGKGKQQAERAAAELAARLPEHYELWVSQAVRSRQTAEFLKIPDRELAEINPDADPKTIPKLFENVNGDATIVLVGHQPWIGDLCAFLLNQCWPNEVYWSVKKGAFWWFRCRRTDNIYRSKLKLMLIP